MPPKYSGLAFKPMLLDHFSKLPNSVLNFNYIMPNFDSFTQQRLPILFVQLLI